MAFDGLQLRSSYVLAAGNTPEPIDLHVAGPEDWQDLRAARLAALQDSPDAFIASYDEELKLPPERWRRSNAHRSVWVLARSVDSVIGIACSTSDLDNVCVRFIESVWVTPRARRQGVACRMLTTLEQHARCVGADELRLWVLGDRLPQRFYLRLGFASAAVTQPVNKKISDGATVVENLFLKKLR